jgi:hypothetical protein
MAKGPKPAYRLPLEPLLQQHQHLSINQALKNLGINHGQFYQWRKYGGITLWAADKIAINKLGVHPSAVWGDLWWDAPNEEAA